MKKAVSQKQLNLEQPESSNVSMEKTEKSELNTSPKKADSLKNLTKLSASKSFQKDLPIINYSA